MSEECETCGGSSGRPNAVQSPSDNLARLSPPMREELGGEPMTDPYEGLRPTGLITCPDPFHTAPEGEAE